MSVAPADWSRALARINGRFPFLERLRGVGAQPEPLPPLLHILTAAGAGMLDCADPKPLALILPRLDSLPFWTALTSCLAALPRDFAQATKVVTAPEPGRMLLDGRSIVCFDGERDGRLWFSMAKANSSIRSAQRLRLQPTCSERPPDPHYTIPTDPPPGPLDALLDIQAYGNRSIFHTQVILVGPLSRHERFLHTPVWIGNRAACQGVTVRDLIQCGKITRGGETECLSPGLRSGEPVLLLASDPVAVREHLRITGRRPLIVLAGSGAWRSRAEAINSLQFEGGRLLFCMDRTEEDELPTLSGIEVWPWGADELRALPVQPPTAATGGAFALFRAATENYSGRCIAVEVCRDPLLEDLHAKLDRLGRQMPRDEAAFLQHALFSFFLTATRACCPIVQDDATEQIFQAKFEYAHFQSEQSRSLLAGELFADVENVLLAFIEVIDRNDTARGGKVAVAARLLRESYQQAVPETVTIVTAGAWETPHARAYYEQRLRPQPGRIRFHDYAGIDAALPSDRLIICGWLSRERMQRLLNLCLAPKITLLLYPFEEAWYERFQHRRERTQPTSLPRSRRAELLQVPDTELPAGLAAPVLPQQPELLGSEEFELAIRHRLPRTFVGGYAGEPETAAHLVWFSEARFAYLTPSHTVPVATDVIRREDGPKDELPSRTVEHLTVGDYVVFRLGSGADLIRETVDLGLRKRNQLGLRKTAALWREALRDFRLVYASSFDPKDASGVRRAVAALKAGGLRRTEATLRWWLDDGNTTIGPQQTEDLRKIAAVTKNAELCARLSQVEAAVVELRGAHQEASHYLARQLLRALGPRLQDGDSGGPMEFDIDGLGRAVVVQVEATDSTPINVPWSLVNRLHCEE